MADRVAVSTELRTSAGLDRVDYADAFGVELVGARTPEQAVLAGLDGVSPMLLGMIARIQGTLLGFRLDPPTATHPLGWRIAESTVDRCVLAADGPLGAGRIVAATAPGRMTLATMLRFDQPRSRLAWVGVAPMHRRVARYLLDRGAARMGDGS